MKYAVEAKVFDNGRMVARVRPARDGEESGLHRDTVLRCMGRCV